jgi:hypothetical protein
MAMRDPASRGSRYPARCCVAVVVTLLLAALAGQARAAKGPAQLIVVVDRSDLGSIAFLPRHTGILPGQVNAVAVDPHGNLFIADNFVGAKDVWCQVRERLAATGATRVIAGALPHTTRGVTPAQRLPLSACRTLAVDANDYLYLISTRFPYGRYPLEVFRINAVSGAVRAIAGCTSCYGFHAGHRAMQSSVDYVNNLAVDRSGKVLLPDSYTGAIWSLSPNGVLERLAANVCAGRAIQYVCPDNVAVARSSTINFDGDDMRVVEGLDPANGKLSIVAGGGSCSLHRHVFCGNRVPPTKARLGSPGALAVDNAGNLFLLEGGVVQRVDAKTHQIEIVAGNGELEGIRTVYRLGERLPALAAAIEPMDLAVGPNGVVYIVDGGGNTAVLELKSSG